MLFSRLARSSKILSQTPPFRQSYRAYTMAPGTSSNPHLIPHRPSRPQPQALRTFPILTTRHSSPHRPPSDCDLRAFRCRQGDALQAPPRAPSLHLRNVRLAHHTRSPTWGEEGCRLLLHHDGRVREDDRREGICGACKVWRESLWDE